MDGEIYRINIKSLRHKGVGLPKNPVRQIFLYEDGFEGDFNHFRHKKYQRGKFTREEFLARAVSIYTFDMIEILNDESYPVTAGDFGENLNINGINYDGFKVGDSFLLGREAIIQISESITPCIQLETLPYFSGVDVNKLLLDRRGWYASVLNPGLVTRGDLIRRFNGNNC